MEVPSLGGSHYFISFIDDCSNWVTMFPIRQKSEAARCYLDFKKYAERQSGLKVRVIRSDRGGEYLSNELQTHFRKNGIRHKLTTAYSPFQNGVAERLNRTLLELFRCMLSGKGLPKYFWAEAISTAVQVKNRVACSVLPSNVTPHHI